MVEWREINPTEYFIVLKNVDKTLKLWGTFQSNLLNLKHKNHSSSKRGETMKTLVSFKKHSPQSPKPSNNSSND